MNHQTTNKLKYYRQIIEKAVQNQGKEDQNLNDKLLELMDELYIFDRDLTEIEQKVKDQKKKRADAKKVIIEIDKAPEKYSLAQIDNMLLNLEEIQDKVNKTGDKVKNTESTIQTKIKELEKLLESSDSKKEILLEIDELNSEIEDDLVKLKDVIEKLPIIIQQVEKSLNQMKTSTGANDDYFELSDQIKEHLAELAEVTNDILEMKKSYIIYSESKEKIKSSIKKQSAENLKKVIE